MTSPQRLSTEDGREDADGRIASQCGDAPQFGGAPHRDGTAGAEVVASDWGWRHAGRERPALAGVDFRVAPGERVLLVGPSGAGKSTLLHALAGVLHADDDEAESTGSLAVGGAPVRATGNGSELGSGTGVAGAAVTGAATTGLMQQDPETQVVQSKVGDDVAFGAENLAVPREEIWPRVREALDAVGLGDLPLDHPTSSLSGGQKQRLALAGILAMRPSLLLLDEPTANLDPDGVEEVRDAVVRVLERTGATAFIVEHRLGAWAPHVDRVLVLEPAGGVLASGTPRELFGPGPMRERLIDAGVWVPGYVPEVSPQAHAGTGRAAVRAGGETGGEAAGTSGPSGSSGAVGASIATARGLAVGRGAAKRGDTPTLAGVDLDLTAGRALCITGPNGVGKSTLALTLGGLLPEFAGDYEYARAGGRLPRRPYSWRAADLVSRIGSVFQEPEHQFVTTTVREELEYGQRHARDDDGERLFSEHEIAERTDRLLARLRLSELAEANPFTLSGGEKRRLSVAAVLATRPRVLVLDEPTFGQDANTWRELAELMLAERRAGTAIIAVTHDEHFAAAIGAEQVDVRDLARRATPDGSEAVKAAAADGAVRAVGEPRGEHPGEAAGAHQPGRSSRPSRPSRLSLEPSTGAATSYLGRTNPLAKLVALAFVTIPLVVSMDFVSAAIVVAATLAMLPLSGVRIRDFLRRTWPLIIAAVFAAWGTALVGEKTGEILFEVGWYSISTGSVAGGLATGLRIFAVALPAVLIVASTDPTDLATGLAQKARLPHRFVLGALAAMRLVGLLAEEWQVLGMARRARGVGSNGSPWQRAKANGGQAFGLIVQAIRRASRLAVSMEAKGFGGPERTWAHESVFTGRDAVVVLGGLLLGVVTVGAAVGLGTWNVVWAS
ncbi:ATP-binding cassette domain-containing protein [Zhihengliuella alba]|uniref:ATP-binding cassette domain-containing protein n=1 Tax=Zhihengliuella alba TaxID=547018 RepID=A0ABP7DGC1_9MICC